MIVIKKVRDASHAYGRGSDDVHIPAVYGVFKDNRQVAFISAKAVKAFSRGPSFWSVNDMNGRELYGSRKGFTAASKWAIEHLA